MLGIVLAAGGGTRLRPRTVPETAPTVAGNRTILERLSPDEQQIKERVDAFIATFDR
jgi:choline kinase